MTTIGPTFPAHIAVSQAEVRLVADQTANADASTLKLDQQSVQTAERIEQEAARLLALDIVT
jgi:cell division protein FtsL